MPIFGRRGDTPAPSWASPLSGSEFASFRKQLTAALKPWGGHELLDGYVRVPGNATQFGLTNLLQQWVLCEPSEREGLVAGHFRAMLQADTTDALGPQELLASLRPRLWSTEALTRVSFSLLKRPVASDLEAVLSVDLPTTVRNLKPEQAEATGWSEEELWMIAMTQIDDGLPVEHEKLGEQIEAFFGDSVFLTSRLLDLERYLGPMPTPGALVAVPHRHMLLCHRITSGAAIKALHSMIPMAADLHKQGPGSLLPHVYWWEPDGSLTLIPAKIDANTIHITAPDRFIAMLQELEPLAQDD